MILPCVSQNMPGRFADDLLFILRMGLSLPTMVNYSFKTILSAPEIIEKYMNLNEF